MWLSKLLKRVWLISFAAGLLAAPTDATACSCPPSAYGAAFFDGIESAVVLSGFPESLGWFRVDLLTGTWSFVGSTDVSGAGEWNRTFWPQPGADRLISWDGSWTVFDSTPDQLYELPLYRRYDSSARLERIDVAFAPSGDVFLLALNRTVQAAPENLLTLRLFHNASGPGAEWIEVGSIEQISCITDNLKLVIESDGTPIALCGRDIYRLQAQSFVLEWTSAQTWIGAADAARDSSGRAVFFVARWDDLARVNYGPSGTWVEAPVAPFDNVMHISAATESSAAFHARDGNLYALRFEDPDWVVSKVAVAPVVFGHVLDAAGSGPAILTSSFFLSLHELGPDGWEVQEFGAIGHEPECWGCPQMSSGFGCNCASGAESSMLPLVLACLLMFRSRWHMRAVRTGSGTEIGS